MSETAAEREFIDSVASSYRPGNQSAWRDVEEYFYPQPGTRTQLTRRAEFKQWADTLDGVESLISACIASRLPWGTFYRLKREAEQNFQNSVRGNHEPEAREDPFTDSVGTQTHADRPSQPTNRPSDRSILDRLDAFQPDFRPGNELILPPAGSVGSHPPHHTDGSSTSHKDPADLYPVDEGDAPPKYRCQGDKKEDMKPWTGDPRWDDLLDDFSR